MHEQLAFGDAESVPEGAAPSEAIWLIWLLRRMQARGSELLDTAAEPELAAVSAMFDGAYAALSAHGYRAGEDLASHRECLVRTRRDCPSAARILVHAPTGP